MFGNKRLDEIIERIDWLNTTVGHLVEQNKELKSLILANRQYTIENKVAIQKERGETKIIEKIVEVPTTRKKNRKSLRTSSGWTQISDEERAEFKRLFEQGLSMTEIATSTGRSGSSISKYLHSIYDGTEATLDGHH